MINLKRDIERLAWQESRLVFPAFNQSHAWELGSLIRRDCEAAGAAMSIEIRLVKATVFFYAMPGTKPNTADWIRRKRNTVELLHRSSYAVGRSLELEGSSLQAKMGRPLRDFAVQGGGFPIFCEGVGCIGAATVSGVPEREDHAIVVRALAALRGVPLHEVELDPAG